VTTESNIDGHYLGDPRFEPLPAELDRRRTPVFVHPTSPSTIDAVSLGLPGAIPELPLDTTRAVVDLVLKGRFQRYPGIPWIFTHGGGALPLLAERVEFFRSAMAGPDDTTEPVTQQAARPWFDMAGTPFPYQMPAPTAVVGSEQVLYGSDYCWTPAPMVKPQVDSLGTAPSPTATPGGR
jgi:predicted TIM-barrel fold metal-dependent hydrolase